MSTIKELRFANGWEVRARPVPPHASYGWEREHIPMPTKPSRPMAEYTSPADGHTEVVTALPGSEEWDQWVGEVKEWSKETALAREAAAVQETEFTIDYAVVEFKHDVLYPDAGWMVEPPDNWQYPNALVKQGVQPGDHRLDFINLEILERTEYTEELLGYAFREDMAPISESEVEAVLDRFQHGDGVSDSGRRVGGDSESAKQSREDIALLRGDAGGRRSRSYAGRLVSFLKKL